jgi:MFS family permease
VALFISTLGMLMATIDGSIVLISLPDIFRGIGIDPLEPGNTFYLLWMILGFLVITSVLVVSLGRMGDIYGRVRTYNLGFAVFTFFSLMLSITWMTGHAAGVWLITMRIFQGVGAAMLMANSAAILTDVFPDNQRGMALGVNQAAAFSGTFIGLVLGGLLAPINWRLIFLVSVPIGLFATVFGYLKLHETRQASAGPHRLAGQHHLRRRPDPGHGGHHLRHRALRAPHHGVDQPDGHHLPGRGRGPP